MCLWSWCSLSLELRLIWGQEFGRASSGCTLPRLIMMDGQHKWHILCNVFSFFFFIFSAKPRKNEEAICSILTISARKRFHATSTSDSVNHTNTQAKRKILPRHQRNFHVSSTITKTTRRDEGSRRKWKRPARLRKTIKPTPRRKKKSCFHFSWHFFRCLSVFSQSWSSTSSLLASVGKIRTCVVAKKKSEEFSQHATRIDVFEQT